MITDLFSITELSILTHKTRPTLYKYINSYENNNLDEVPYSFIKLFDLMCKQKNTRNQIVEYCNANFAVIDSDSKVNEIVALIKNNKSKINLDDLKKIIEEEIRR